MPPDHLPTTLLRLKEQLFNQMPLVGGWLRRRAAASLASDGSPLAVEILASALDRLPDVQVQQLVARTVESVQDTTRIDAVCRAWAQTRSPGLKRLIRARGWRERLTPKGSALLVTFAVCSGRCLQKSNVPTRRHQDCRAATKTIDP